MTRIAKAHSLAQKQDAAIRRLEERRRERRASNAGDTQKSRSRPATPSRDAVLGSPFDGRHVRTGESPNTSRGYEFHRLAALQMGLIGPEYCKVELESAHCIEKSMMLCPGFNRTPKSIVAPFCPLLMQGNPDFPVMPPEHAAVLTQKMWEPVKRFDPEEAAWLTKKFGVGNTEKSWDPETQKVAASQLLPQQWTAQAYGGALVPPPEWGPLIPLLRNQNAMLRAGATVIPLPPGGRIVMPRQTAASIVYHAGEGQPGTQTNVQTNQFELSPKLIIGLFVVNNQLLKFGGPAVEQMFRNDLTLSLSLQLDYDCLQGAGSDNVVAGLIGYPGVQNYAGSTPAPAGIGTNGNTFYAADVYAMEALVYAANAPEFEGWIMHPLLIGRLEGARGGTGAGAQTGPFLFQITRGFEDGRLVERLASAKMTRSTNVPLNRTKGSGTGLTVAYGGQWSNYRLGMYGSVEIAVAEQGTPYFAQYQTQIRGVLQADGGPLNPGVFSYYDDLLIAAVS